MHFFSPANVMRLLEVVRGEKTAQGRARHRDGAGQEDQQDRGRVGRLRRLHRQPHARAVRRQAGFLLEEGATAAAGGQGDGELRLRDGAVPHGRPGRARHRLGDPQAPLRREARHALLARRPTCCASWAASARRPAPAGTTTSRASATRSPTRWSTDDDRAVPQGARHHRRARSATTRSSSAASTRWSTKARASSKRGIAAARQRHRHRLPHRLRLPAHRGGPMFYADTSALQRGAAHEALRREPARRHRLLAARAAAGEARRPTARPSTLPASQR